MQRLQVAVVGSGPAGLYTAEALIKQAAALTPPREIRVDVIDRLPTPYGLVRYGVAPDHKSIKSIAEYLRNVLEHDRVGFIGGVHLGDDVTREDLLGAYDAVVYATGAMRGRHLGIPGEDLSGSIAATDFVNWYCGHPDVDPDLAGRGQRRRLLDQRFGRVQAGRTRADDRHLKCLHVLILPST